MLVGVECSGESAQRYGAGESVMVNVLVYISNVCPSLLYLVARQCCIFLTSYLGGFKQRCRVCKC